MGRSKPNPLQTINFMHSFNKLNKGTLSVFGSYFSFAIAVYYLPQQGHFFYSIINKPTALCDYIFNASAPLTATGIGYNTERTKLITALHNTHESCYPCRIIFCLRQVFTNGSFTPLLSISIHHSLTPSCKQIVQILPRPVNFLGTQNQVHIRQLINQLLPSTLRHTPHKPE